MKKWTCLLCAALFLLALPFSAAAAGTAYTLDELYMTIDIPDELVVLTRDSVSDESVLELLGTDMEEIRQSFVASDIYLNAMPEDFDYEMIVAMTTDSDIRKVWDFALYKDRDFEDFYEGMESEARRQGIKLESEGVYRTDAAVFYMVAMEQTMEGLEVESLQYYTVYNGMAILITLTSYDGPVTRAQAAELRQLVDSVRFTETLTNPNPRSTGIVWTDILSGGLGAAVVGGIVGALASILGRSSRLKKELALCLVDNAFPGEAFEYKGKRYDTQRYISGRMMRLSTPGQNSKTLQKQLDKAQKRAARQRPDAVIDQLEAEALRRLLLGPAPTAWPGQPPYGAYPAPPAGYGAYPAPPPGYGAAPQAQPPVAAPPQAGPATPPAPTAQPGAVPPFPPQAQPAAQAAPQPPVPPSATAVPPPSAAQPAAAPVAQPPAPAPAAEVAQAPAQEPEPGQNEQP